MKYILSLSIILTFLGCRRSYKSENKSFVNKPNIILIIADDAGYADFGYQGCKKFKTPNIDALAKNGIRFTTAFVTGAVCSPSRAGLITGRYPQRFGHECNLPGVLQKDYTENQRGMDIREFTIADLLKKEGYITKAIGKWHLGFLRQFRPCNRGFDEFYGFLGGSRTYFPKNDYDSIKHIMNGWEFTAEHGYTTTNFGQSACEFIKRNKDRPFFIDLAFNAVHTPMDALPKQEKLFKKIKDQTRRKLAAMTLEMDNQVGNIVRTLRELKLEDNTLIFFINDNGGPTPYNGSINAPLSGTKGTFLDGGIRVPFLMQWPARLPKNRKFSGMVSSLDILPTLISAAGGKLPDDRKYDGVNLLPYILNNNKKSPHDILFWRRENFAAVRTLTWKLIRFPDTSYVLYNLINDPTESHNIVDNFPQKKEELINELKNWEKEMHDPIWINGPFWQKHDWRLYGTYGHVVLPDSIKSE